MPERKFRRGSVVNIRLTRLGERGQMVIPKALRHAMKLPQGTMFSIVMVDEDTLMIKRFDEKRIYAEFNAVRAIVREVREERG